jgi:hypothetical protein
MNTTAITLYDAGSTGALFTTVASGTANACTATANVFLQGDGATPGGAWRSSPIIANASALMSEDVATNAVQLIGIDASDDIGIGDPANVNNVVVDALTSHSLDIGGTPALAIDSGGISIGSPTATGGVINIPNNVKIRGRDTGGVSRDILEWNNLDDLYIGNTGVDNVMIRAGAEWFLTAGGTTHVESSGGTAIKLEVYNRLKEQALLPPSGVANYGQVCTFDVGGVTELYYTDSAGSHTQLTSAGASNIFGSGTDNRVARFHNTNAVQNTGVTIDDSDNTTLPDGAVLSFGTTACATSGVINWRNNSGGIYSRDASDGSDAAVLRFTSGDDIYLGDSANGDLIYIESTTGIKARVGGSPILDIAASLITAAQDVRIDDQYLSFGDTVSSPTIRALPRTSGASTNLNIVGQENSAVDQSGGSVFIKSGLKSGGGAGVDGYMYMDANTHQFRDRSGAAVRLSMTSSLITAAQDVTLADGKALSFGTTNVAASGVDRRRNNAGQTYFRNAAAGADIRAMHVDSNDYAWFSDGNNAVQTSLSASNSWYLRIGALATLSSTASLITAAQNVTLADGKVLSLGTTACATSGDLNFRNGSTVYARNNANSGDIRALSFDTSDNLTFGFNNALLDDIYFQVPTGQNVYFQVAGGTVLTIAGALITSAQDFRVAAGKDVDCYTNGGYLKPQRTSQSSEPTPDTAEIRMFHDTDDGKTYLVYQDPTVGTRRVELV